MRKQIHTLKVDEKMFKNFSNYLGTFSGGNDYIVSELVVNGKKYFVREVLDGTYRIVDEVGIYCSGIDKEGNKINFPRLTSARKLEDWVKDFVKNGGKII